MPDEPDQDTMEVMPAVNCGLLLKGSFSTSGP